MLNKTISTLLSTLLISSVLFTSQALAKGNQTTVTFKAAIVIPPCSYNVQDNNMNLNCFNQTKNKMESTAIDFKKQSKSLDWKELSDNRGIYQLKWTNQDKGFAMFSVQHA
ncbi:MULTISPECIES: fimbrial protein [Providencia]|uniref:Uncharacterized protein n=4 Tax=Providencia rustigianii TaxID=158850 RepID=D1P7N6_9GAMM|nr:MULTISPECIES: hypothetical protein [Providencia]EFB70557.1 hypothetical protein PROVRUST_08259 [Providencia rustigianii DSM 4541]MTC55677.1 pilus assembly protein [Providencia rustigianii]SPY79267.1 Uncharacterised protein [Providencia rustigianii]SUC28947.1 Uncharacterised protein [Providencia rustigianii]SUC37241.1 Uncharacterised protein [Providencia rustigianii]